MTIEALSGGTINLQGLNRIADPNAGDTRQRSIDLTADGAGSTIRLDLLTSFSDAYGNGPDAVDGRWSTLVASHGGGIVAPNLATLAGVGLTLDGTGTLPTAQITAMSGGGLSISNTASNLSGLSTVDGTQISIVGVHQDLHNLGVLRDATLTLGGGGTADLGGVIDLDGTSLFVGGGVTLALPSVVTYNQNSNNNFQTRTLHADGAGSRLDLSHLTNLTNGTNFAALLEIEAFGGGTVDLSGVTQIVDPNAGDLRQRAVDVTADGAGSVVRLDSLVNFLDPYGTGAGAIDPRWSTLTARNGGSVIDPKLTTVRGVNVSIVAAQATAGVPSGSSAGAGAGTSFAGTIAPAGPPPSAPSASGTVYWTGGSGDWNDPSHWSTGAVPGPDDDVVIGVPGPVTVTISGGGPRVRSIRSQDDLTIGGGASLTVTLGASTVAGALTVAPNATLTAQGGTATFQASGTTTIDGANLYALDGGALTLPQAQGYLQSPTSNDQARTIEAHGYGSRIDLRGLATLANGADYDSHITIDASLGGAIDLRGLAQITDPNAGDTRRRSIDITADGFSSAIRLDSLTSFTDAYGIGAGSIDGQWSTLTVQDGATLSAPLLATLQGVSFTIGGGANPSPLLSSLKSGQLVVGAGSNISMSGLTTIDGSRFLATGGGQLSIPATSYAFADGQNDLARVFRAEGAGSLLDLHGLTSLTNGTSYDSHLRLEAVGGATLNLSGATQIADANAGDTRHRSIDILVDGAGSTIRLDALATFNDVFGLAPPGADGQWSTLTVNDGTVIAPLLTSLSGVDLVLTGAATMQTTQISSVQAGGLTLSGNDRDFSGLTVGTSAQISISGAHVNLSNLAAFGFGSLSLTSGGTADVGRLAQIDGASFFVGGGVTLSLPSAVSYNQGSNANVQTRTFHADGAGSRLDLGHLATLTNGTYYASLLEIEAFSGGTVDLSGVGQIIDPGSGDTRQRGIDVTADDGTVRLDALTTFSDAFGNGSGAVDGRWSTLRARDGGTIVDPRLTALNGVDVTLDGTGTIGTSQIVSMVSGRFNLGGATADFGGLTDATNTVIAVDGVGASMPNLVMLPGATVTLSNGGTLAVPAVTDIDGASLYVHDGSTLAFPAVVAYTNATVANIEYRSLHAEGVGSRIDLSHVLSVTNGTSYAARLAIEAVAGGTVDLSSATTFADPTSGDTRQRSIDVTAEGAGSTIKLDALTTFTDPYATGAGDVDNRWSTLTSLDHGKIVAPRLTTLGGVYLTLDGTGGLDTAQIATLAAGGLGISGGSYAFTALTDASNAQFRVSHVAIAMPALTTLTQASVTLANRGTISLPLVSKIDGASFFVGGGVTLSLPSATSYAINTPGDNQVATILAQDGSRIDLGHVATLGNGNFGGSQLAVTGLDGGSVDLGGLANETGGSIAFTADGAGSVINLANLPAFSSNVRNNSSLNARDGGQVALGAGTVPLTQVDVNASSHGTISGGTLIIYSGGSLSGDGTIRANVITSASVSPGNGGTGILTIAGNFAQYAASALNVELSGLSAGTQFDQLAITGTAQLAGTLNVTYPGGFTPQAGDSFPVVTFASEAGQFGTYNNLAHGTGQTFLTLYDPADFTLKDTLGAIRVAPTSGLFTSKQGDRASFSVVLGTQPSANVTIALGSSNPNEGLLAPDPQSPGQPSLTVTFTPANWNTPQVVSVVGVDDHASGSVNYQIVSGASASIDANYNGLRTAPVSLTNLDNERLDLQVGGLSVTPPAGLQSGAGLVVHWNDTNTGNLPANAAWDDQVVIVNTTTNTTLLSTTIHYDPAAFGTLAANGSLARLFAFTLPNDATGAGNLQVTVTTDVNHTVVELDGGPDPYANNSSSVTVAASLAPYPDLQVGNLTVSPSIGLQSGSGFLINWNDVNTGNAPTPSSWDDLVVIRNTTTNTTIGSTTLHYDATALGAIGINGSTARQLAFTIPDGVAGVGTIVVSVTVDQNGAFFESNPAGTGSSNNTSSVTVNSSSASYPDLHTTNLAVAPTALHSGDKVTVGWNDQNTGSVPTTTFGPIGGTPAGLLAVYYSNQDFTGQAVARIDPTVNFDFVATPPPSPTPPGFSTRWLGQVTATTSEPYTFYTESDDGVRLWVDGQLLVDNFTTHGATENSGTINLIAGRSYDIRMEYFENGSGAALAQLLWSSPTVPKEIIPTAQLSHPTTGGFYDEVKVTNTSQNVVVFDDWSYYDPAAPGNGNIEGGGSRARAAVLHLPQDQGGVGNILFTVTTDAGNFVKRFDASGNADNGNTASLTLTSALTGSFPDLVVPQASVTFNTSAGPVPPNPLDTGASVTVRWDDQNVGNGPTDTSWSDSVTIVDTTTGQPLASASVPYDAATLGNLIAGASAHRQFTFTLPDGDPGVGNIRATITVNAGADQTEANPSGTATTNNTTSASVTSVLASYPDLTVPQSSLAASPTSPNAGGLLTVNWVDQNVGGGDVTASFNDLVEIDNLTTGQTLITATVPYDVTTLGPLAAGSSSTVRHFPFTLPAGAAGTGQLRIIVTTDSGESVFEYSTSHQAALANNVATTTVTSTAIQTQLPVLAVQAVTPSASSAQFGGPLGVSWTVTNLGGSAASGAWLDAIYLSTSQVLDGGAMLMGTVPADSVGSLPSGGQYTHSSTLTLPLRASLGAGTYYILVQADTGNVINQGDRSLDVGASAAISLAVPSLPDLALTDVQAPAAAEPGQAVTFSWTVGNLGTADAAGPWQDRLYVSPDGQLADATALASIDRSLGLAHGANYTATAPLTLPSLADGDYTVLVLTDATNAIFEGPQEANNLKAAVGKLHVTHPALTPSITAAPATASSGGAVNVTWTTADTGTGDTLGGWVDRLYLSSTPQLAGDALLLGQASFNGPIAAGTNATGTVNATLPVNLAGDYLLRGRRRRQSSGGLLRRPRPRPRSTSSWRLTPTWRSRTSRPRRGRSEIRPR